MKEKYIKLQDEFYDAKYEEDEDRATQIAGELADLSIKIAQEEILPSIQETVEERVAQRILGELQESEEEIQYADANQTALDIFDRHPELLDEGGKLKKRFSGFVEVERANGSTVKEAFLTVEKMMFGDQGDTSGEDNGTDGSLSQRELLAKLKNAKAANRQPPNLAAVGMSGRDKDKTMRIEDLTEDEFDALSEQQKAKLRGDLI